MLTIILIICIFNLITSIYILRYWVKSLNFMKSLEKEEKPPNEHNLDNS